MSWTSGRNFYGHLAAYFVVTWSSEASQPGDLVSYSGPE
jgi:hypothetical protein